MPVSKKNGGKTKVSLAEIGEIVELMRKKGVEKIYFDCDGGVSIKMGPLRPVIIDSEEEETGKISSEEALLYASAGI